MGARGLFGGSSRQNSGISLGFCLLRWARTPFLKAAVDKIPTLLSIFVYFDGRAIFGGSGRQNQGISHGTIAAARHCKNKFRSRELCIL